MCVDNRQAPVAEIEALLARAEGRLDQVVAAMDHLESGVVLYGSDDRVVFCNARFRELYAEVADLLVPGTPYTEIARAYFRRGFEARTGLSEEEYVRARAEYHRNPDGRDYEFQHGDKYWLLVSDRKTRDGGVIGLRVDITARKLAEQEREASEARFKSLLEMSSDWYWEQDDQFRFTVMSQGLVNLGEAPQNLIGRRRWELDYGGLTEEQWELHKRQLEAHEPFRGLEFTFTRSTGEERWVTVTGEPVFDRAGKFVGYRGVGTDVTVRKRYEAKIRELAEYDFLTGLPNRNLLSARFSFAARSAERTRRPMALLFIDLDRFKTVNDLLGHPTGDKLLKQIATRLMHIVRATDTVCRHGGDEFLVLLPEVDEPENAARVAQEIVTELAKPYTIDGYELIVTPSLGISFHPADGTELQALIRNADAAMYHSKAMGRNRFSFFKEEMNAKISERLALENGLRRGAVARRVLPRLPAGVRAQPRLDLGCGGPSALAPPGARAGPAVALRAHRRGLGTDPRDRRVGAGRGVPPGRPRGAARACAPPVRVNFSGIQFRQRNLLELLVSTLARHGLDPQCLGIEVTESVLLGEVEMSSGLLASLSEAGFRLAIDDFGTGYSSLAYLTRLPIETLKIDQTFVRDLFVDKGGAALTRGIIGLAGSLRLKVAAEGVETASQLEFLRDAGCDEAQGFYLSPPVPPERIAELLRA